MFCSSQSGCATARARFFGRASAGITPTVERRPATAAPAISFLENDIFILCLFFWVWKNCVTGMRKKERSAAGACDAAVVNNATFNKVHRDYLSLGT
jgi:hypothetical protein